MSAQVDTERLLAITHAIAVRNVENYRLLVPGLGRAQLEQLQLVTDELAGVIDRRLAEFAAERPRMRGLDMLDERQG